MRYLKPLLLILSLFFAASAAIDTSQSKFYMYTYFIQGPEEQAAGARLAFSTDGITWEKYKNEEPFIKPATYTATGERPLMRDPNIYFDSTTGVFHMTWTTAWKQKNIGYATSKDLINWSAQMLIPVGKRIKESKCCWAPEFFYDDTRDSIMVTWSTQRGTPNKEAFCCFTKDFKTYSSPEVYFAPELTGTDEVYNVIDETILKVAPKKYYLFFKDERSAGGGIIAQVIRCTFSDNPKGPWWKGPNESASMNLSGIGFEGPTAYIIGDEVRVSFDPFGKRENTDRLRTVKLNDLLGSEAPTTWNKGPVMKTTTGESFLPSHGSISVIPKAKLLQVLYNIPDRTVYKNSWTDIKQSDITVKSLTGDDDYPLGPRNCGCGTGVGLAFIPPIFIKGWALRRRKKQNTKTK
jgi:beta-galactosidase